MSAKVNLICETCETPFERYRSQLKREGRGRYCSPRCKAARPLVETVRGVNAGIRAAHEAGYRATHDGRILDPEGQPVNLSRHPRSGYWSFSARRCRSPLAVHKFVAYQLHGEAALRAECVRHLNDNRDDNSFGNIAYGTRSQNQLDIPVEKRRLMGTRRNRTKRQFSDEQVREIRLLLTDGWSLNRLQRVFNCSFGALTNIRDGITYQDVK